MRTIMWACFIILWHVWPVGAEPIGFRFTAKISPFGTGPIEVAGLQFFPGEDVSGRFNLDTGVGDFVRDPNVGLYLDQRGQMNWASSHASWQSQRGVDVVVGVDPFGEERSENLIQFGGSGQGTTFLIFGGDDLVSSDAIPTNADLLMQFPSRTFLFLEPTPGDNDPFVVGTITSLAAESAAPIPEPSTLLLLGVGALGAIKSRRQRGGEREPSRPARCR